MAYPQEARLKGGKGGKHIYSRIRRLSLKSIHSLSDPEMTKLYEAHFSIYKDRTILTHIFQSWLCGSNGIIYIKVMCWCYFMIIIG